jgi:hypothetical protein
MGQKFKLFHNFGYYILMVTHSRQATVLLDHNDKFQGHIA